MREDKKVRPKFTTKFLSKKVPDASKIKKLIYWCSEFGKNDLMPSYGSGTFGNMSFRVKGDRFMITASGIKSPFSDESFVLVSSVDLKDKIVSVHGKRKPSSESMMHYLIYKERKDINAIFHGHSEIILKRYKTLALPSTLKEEEYGTIELAKSVLDVLDDHLFLIMKGHGFISIGKNMDIAGKQALEILKKI